MSIANLTSPQQPYDDGLASIVITLNLQAKPGGATLDTTGFTPTVIRAGHVIIFNASTKQYRPMPVTGQFSIAVLGIITGGTLYTPASNTAPVLYPGVALTGGTGAGATADIYVSGGSVTAVNIVAKGTGYTAGDTLSAAAANIGGTGSGFTVNVSSVNEAGAYAALPAGWSYYGILIMDILTAKPFAGIMVRGNFNPIAAPYDFATISAAFMTATGNRISAFAD